MLGPVAAVGCSLLLPLTALVTAAVTPFPVSQSVVEFAPRPGSGGPVCQGVFISKSIIATSPSCVKETMESSKRYAAPEVRDIQGDVLGVVSGEVAGRHINDTRLSVIPNPGESGLIDYPSMYTASLPPEKAFAVFIDGNRRLSRQTVSLGVSDTASKTVFLFYPQSAPPSGSPVFDTQNRLICLTDFENQCIVARNPPEAQVELDGDPDDEGSTVSTTQVGVVTAAAVASVAIPTTLFYLLSYLKARSVGMPASVFWVGILTCQYCAHCSIASALPAIIGTITCPVSGALSIIIGYPVSACMTAANWADHYAAQQRISERTPIVQQPLPQHYPPGPPPLYTGEPQK